MIPRIHRLWFACVAATAAFGGVSCGTSELPTDSNADWAQPGILLGNWIGANLEHQRQADPSIVVQITDTFTLDVDVTGRYIATLLPGAAVEQGWIRVDGPSVTFRPTSPPGDDDLATLLVVADTLVLTGDSAFDFGTGAEEPSVLTIDLVAR